MEYMQHNDLQLYRKENVNKVSISFLSTPIPEISNQESRCVFSSTGYGYITPQTTEGQILCIFVSLIGIPITMLALKSVGEVLAKLINTIVTKFERKVLKRPDPRKVETKSAMFLFSFTVITLFVGGWFQTFKNLTVTEGVYMWYITFTTIGFGDYVPFKRSRTVVKFSEDGLRYHGELSDSEKPFPDYFGWLILSIGILGLCVVSAVLNSIMAVIEERKFRPRCHGCIPRKIQNHTNSKQPNPSEQAEIGETCLEIENCGFEKENIASTNSAKLERVCQRKALKYALPLTFRGSSYEERLTMLDLTTRQGGLIYLC